MQSLKNRYFRLVTRALSSSVDYGRSAIYLFQKYCRHCGEGLNKPNAWDTRSDRALWRKSFCSEECVLSGKRLFQSNSITCKPTHPSHKKEHAIEECAFLSIEIDREEEKLPPVLRSVLFADRSFRLLSEKLRFLEVQTGESWSTSRFYYWLNKSPS